MLSIVAGAIALVWPDATVVALAIVFGLQLFVLGISRVVGAFAMPESSAAAKVLSVVLGVLPFIVGILCLRSPLQTVVVLTLVLGAFWLIHGVVDIVIGSATTLAWLLGLLLVLQGIIVIVSVRAVCDFDNRILPAQGHFSLLRHNPANITVNSGGRPGHRPRRAARGREGNGADAGRGRRSSNARAAVPLG